MTSAEVLARFKAALEADPDYAPLVMVAAPMLNQPPAAIIAALDGIIEMYAEARGTTIRLPEVT